jgi:hypothetical protein
MRNRRDWGVVWVALLAAACWYGIYQHETLATWAHRAVLSLWRKY